MPFVLPAIFAVATAILMLTPADARAQPQPGPWRADFQAIVAELDSNDFSRREAARMRLNALSEQRGTQQVLADEIHKQLSTEQLSMEVRSTLAGIASALPAAVLAPIEAPGEELVDVTFDRLNAETAAEREMAAAQFDRILATPALIDRAYRSWKERVRKLPASDPARSRLEAFLKKARGAWLMSDSRFDELLSFDEEAVNRLLDTLADAHLEGNSKKADTARIDLCDLLGRDTHALRIKEIIEKRLPAIEQDTVKNELKQLASLTHPAIVAEIWQKLLSRSPYFHLAGSPWLQIKTIQHLLLGVPTKADTARNPSHFDKITETSAHCVSGNSLSPGDYPVGVFFPPPNPTPQADWVAAFHLVNLPTARRRQAYAFIAALPEADRLAEVTERTMKMYLARGVPLELSELEMLRFMDPRTVSRYAGKLMLAIPDRPLDIGAVNSATYEKTHHQYLCEAIVEHGTKDVIPDLLKAIDAGRFLPTNYPGGRAFQWMTVLGVAERDPWPGADEYLATLVTRGDLLTRDEAINLGANAAAVLLKRRGEDPTPRGLVVVRDRTISEFGVELYRYGSPARRDEVLRYLGIPAIPAK